MMLKIATTVVLAVIIFTITGCDESEIKRDFKISNVASFPYEIEGLKNRWYFCEKCLKDKRCKTNNVKQCNEITLPDRSEALSLAMSRPNTEAVYFLVDVAKADVNGITKDDNDTPLMNAAYYGSKEHQQIAKHLISLGADVNTINELRPNNTALLVAIWKNNIDFARLLIDNGAILDMSPVTGVRERSACEAAIVYGRAEIIPFIDGCCNLIKNKPDLMPATFSECK
ncbi:ankyrin repeat domain-containing protein [Rahnella sp. FRB 231]|uniref:Ankyrin repeat domain-containing protein n=2 Tax=Rahnella ecdela TaxID=2816250 RepID=A0ABS6LAG1_9GAMM|nr:ankyrin repeat domain-containing protein [Rahnella ecdela]